MIVILSEIFSCGWGSSSCMMGLCLWRCQGTTTPYCIFSSFGDVGEPYQEEGQYVTAEEYAHLCGSHVLLPLPESEQVLVNNN